MDPRLHSRLWPTALAVLSLALCAGASAQYLAAPQPEGSSGLASKPGWATKRFAVAAANPLATDAGFKIIMAGGSAVDAAVAVQMVLALVEPQASGLGGGAFLLHFDGSKIEAFDGRETAPAAAHERLFLDANGRPLPFMQAVVGGRAVGAPGALRMLELAHRQHGRLPWPRLFEPAIALAERGFKISPRMYAALLDARQLRNDPVAASFFFDAAGHPLPVGHVLQNPELASVLRQIAAEGSSALHQGRIAQAIVDKVRQHPDNPGLLSLSDLFGYQAIRREPLCFEHRVGAAGQGAAGYRICGMPPPSSGAIAIGQIMGTMSRLASVEPALEDAAGVAVPNCMRLPCPDLPAGIAPGARWLHQYLEASRLAYADRAKYLADPAFVDPPAGNWSSLLDPGYLTKRAALIGAGASGRRMNDVKAGNPGTLNIGTAPMPDQPEYGTSHISIVDPWGHALAMTSTIEFGWGSHLMVNRGLGLGGGFLLNNELTDFSFEPTDASGAPVANRVQAGKRPRSSMSPTLVFKAMPDGSLGPLVMSSGSALGSLIIHFTAKTLYGVLDWNLSSQQAIDLPNFATLGGPALLEQGRFPRATVDALKARGHQVLEIALPSGLQTVQRTPDGWYGGADPRREGVVMGE